MMLLLVSLFSLRAQAQERVFYTRAQKVYFQFDKSAVNSAYMSNAQSLSSLDSLVAAVGLESLESVKVISFSSPEGNYAYNLALSKKRTDAVYKLLTASYPSLAGKIELDHQGEAWQDLRNSVVNDTNFTEEIRNKILSIIDSDRDPSSKEAALKALPEYKRLYSSYFKQFRYAEIRLRIANSEEVFPPMEEIPVLEEEIPVVEDSISVVEEVIPEIEIAIPEPEVVVEEPEVIPEPEIPVISEEIEVEEPEIFIPQADTLVVEEIVAEHAEHIIVPEPVVEEPVKSTPLFALGANLLHTSATAFVGFHAVPLSVGYEVPIGQHWSIQSNYIITLPWQAWNNNADAAELMHWDLSARWYPGGSFTRPFSQKENRRVLDGWYAYAGMGMGYYDFERDGRGYQGEELLGSVGIGYNLTLGKHWSLDFGLGVGPMYSRYRYYVGRSNNEHLMFQYSGSFTYFGITDARISLTYLLYHNRKIKNDNR